MQRSWGPSFQVRLQDVWVHRVWISTPDTRNHMPARSWMEKDPTYTEGMRPKQMDARNVHPVS